MERCEQDGAREGFPEEVTLRKNDQGFVVGPSGQSASGRLLSVRKEVAAEAGSE